VVELQIHGPDVVEKNEPVTITVTDKDGDPVSGVDINVGSTELGVTDESGQIAFSFDSLAPGEVTVTASKTTSGDRWFREDSLILTIPK
jgi:protocatechuate 3,4-dioxygenase beta subunit